MKPSQKLLIVSHLSEFVDVPAGCHTPQPMHLCRLPLCYIWVIIEQNGEKRPTYEQDTIRGITSKSWKRLRTIIVKYIVPEFAQQR